MYFKKVTCPECQTRFDCVEKECPNCHKENSLDRKYISKGVSWIHPLFQLGYFLIGFCGLFLISTIISVIIVFIDRENASSVKNEMLVNSLTYILLFIALFILSIFNQKKIIDKLKDWKPYIVGIIMGGVVIGASILWSTFVEIVHPVEVNQNEQAVRTMTAAYPVMSIIIFGFVGPIVEELTYRLGFFSLMSRVSRIFAYVISSLLFGILHFDFMAADLVAEFLNLPSYVICGVLLALTYDYHGIGASCVAHMTNNLISTIWTIMLQ